MPYYLTAVVIVILLKFAFMAAGNKDLVLLLVPTDKLAGWLMGSKSVFLQERGFYHETLNVIIGRACAGINFLILSFLCFSYLTINFFEKPLHKCLAIPASFAGAYLLTIFVNTSRIFVSVAVQNQAENIFPQYKNFIHSAVGTITNLSFLILAYYLTEKFLENRRRYAKSI